MGLLSTDCGGHAAALNFGGHAAALVFCLLLLSLAFSPALAGEPEPKAAPAFKSAYGERTAPRTTDLPDDNPCHGPKYHKIKAEALAKVDLHKSRLEVERFSVEVGARLREAAVQERSRIIAAQRDDYAACLKRTRRPSVLCSAVVSGQADLCRELATADDRGGCVHATAMTQAIRRGDPAPCARIEEGPVRQVCELVADRRLACAEIADGVPRQVCAALADSLAPGSPIPRGLPEEALPPFLWLLALLRQEATPCDSIPGKEEAEACRAAVTGEASKCTPLRPTIEHIDNDYSCRRPLVATRVHTTALGTEVVAVLASGYAGNAACDVKVRAGAGAAEALIEAGSVSLAETDSWKKISVWLTPCDRAIAELSCTWDPATSRFVLKEEGSRVW